MNCDQVFDVLTRGPFPTGADSDSAVERHLEFCPECRRLATALRPALELFEEAVGPEESRGLPAYWGEVCEAACDVSAATDTQERLFPPRRALRPVRRRTRPPRARVNSLMFTGAALLGLVLAAAIHLMLPRSGTVRAEGIEAIMALQPAPDCLVTSASPPAPVTAGIASDDRVTNLDELRCCLECHDRATSHLVDQDAAGRIGRSCRVCHL